MAQPELLDHPAVGKRFPFRVTDVSIQFDGHLVKPHWHDHIELVKVVKGRVLVTLDQDQFEAGEEDIVFINSRQIHSIRSLTDRQDRINGIIFDKFFVTNFLEGFDSMHACHLFVSAGACSGRLSISPGDPIWSDLNEGMEAAKHEFNGKRLCYEMAIKSSIYRILTAVIRSYWQPGAPIAGAIAGRNEHKLSLIRPALNYIEEHIAEPVSVDVLCKASNVSPNYLSRLFKEVVGVTITRYLTSTRIHLAKRMLAGRELTVTEIAERSGFCNIHYFGKKFKEETGFSPSEFRSNVKKLEL
ncbi:AraC family transcriptional regulator [Paenibacillus ginsengarvi]|nr:AraC family transcriptional regulator [Paenibacillus ginsengarvi]